jgi:hypothetical protein
MTNTLLRAEFNRLFGLLSVYADINDIKFIHGNEGYYRTAEQQKALFDAGKSKCDGVKIISRHQSHLARDLYVINGKAQIVWDDSPYIILGAYWKKLGGTWGGYFEGFRDIFHFEI